MASLRIAQYANLAAAGMGGQAGQALHQPPVTANLNPTTGAKAVVTLNAATKFVELYGDGAAVLVKFNATSSTAITNVDMKIGNGERVIYAVGDGTRYLEHWDGST